MNKTVIAIVLILAAAAVAGNYIWSSFHRYQVVTGANGVAYQIDTETGNSWMLYGTRKVPQAGNTSSTKTGKELPESAARKVTGNAAISFGYFSGKLYNGSNWTLTKAVVKVTAKEKNGSVRWVRDFAVPVAVSPLSTNSFSVSVTVGEGVASTSWSIERLYGYRQ